MIEVIWSLSMQGLKDESLIIKIFWISHGRACLFLLNFWCIKKLIKTKVFKVSMFKHIRV